MKPNKNYVSQGGHSLRHRFSVCVMVTRCPSNNSFCNILGVYGQERPAPEFLSPVPIRKTRAGLQFTCAAPTLPPIGQAPDVWVSLS